jgi:hypothetical protein
MRTLWVLTLGVVALTAVQGCKRKEEPIPGPKAGLAAMAYVHAHTPGIAYFQGSLDEAFAGTLHRNCREHTVAAPRTTETGHSRKHPNLPSPVGACGMESCPPITRPRHRLV